MINISHVSKTYELDDGIFTALDNVSLSIKHGEYTAILGPSGCGKSTLMHIIGLLDNPSKGKVEIDEVCVEELSDFELSSLRSRFIGFVFQQFNLINKLTVLENVIMPSIYSRDKIDFNPKERALELLTKFGIEAKKNSYPNKLSGGQQQRVAIARALIMKPKIILADEPTGNLDTKNGKIIMELIEDLNKKEKITVVIVTHDPEIAKKTKRQIVMRDGKIL
jgi:putative ABC transport system ATP-binding protein